MTFAAMAARHDFFGDEAFAEQSEELILNTLRLN